MAAEFKTKYPLHCLVWDNAVNELKEVLNKTECELEVVDAKGRTPLHLSVSLSHFECTRLLLHKGANVLAENAAGWSVLHEAISTGDPETVAVILQYRDYTRAASRADGIPKLLEQLRNSPDFYVEMKWEFTSWIPFLSKVCPNDVYRVWKKGSYLRVDTTLLGFDQMSWQRGKRSFIFKAEESGVTVIETDHDAQKAYIEELSSQIPTLEAFAPTQEQVLSRLTQPLVCTHLNTDEICFERAKSGIWGWRSNKVDTINGYPADSFVASNVEFVTKTRTEHIDSKEMKKQKGSNVATNALNSLLGMAKQHNNGESNCQGTDVTNKGAECGPEGLTAEQYFTASSSQDIGRPIELQTKVQRFKAVVWQSTEYPLSLQQQVTPFVDLMAISNAHFAKLKDFINLKLPEGFPIKIEIPLFHVLNACITFGNLNEVDSKTGANKEANAEYVVDEGCFDIPDNYTRYGSAHSDNSFENEDERLLQLAIQQSLLDPEAQVSFLEVLNSAPSNGREESIYESMPSDLEMAIAISKREDEEEMRRQKHEEEELEKILKLSMIEK